MAAFITGNDVLKTAAKNLQTTLQSSCFLHLTTGPVPTTSGAIPSNFVDPIYTGYVPISVSAFVGQAIKVIDGHYQIPIPELVFRSNGGTAAVILGWFVLQTLALGRVSVIMFGALPTPVVMNPGSELAIQISVDVWDVNTLLSMP